MMYITLEEFKNSNYYCLYTKCCEDTRNEDMLITELINIASNLVRNYLCYDIQMTNRKESFNGRDNNTYHTRHYPLSGSVDIYYRDKRKPSITGTIETIITDDRLGVIQTDYVFCSNNKYFLSYLAGYEVIPDDIKNCVKHIVAHISQQIDTGNINNPDMGQASGKLDNLITYTVNNNSGTLKNLLLKSTNDVKNLPQTVYPILNRYKKGNLT